ncbi:serine/threonine protein kinase [Nonomuraea sp. H19]|uniref:serine/threonine protein kinase n=1 Tax=Nonomuraea sp. H19 TaxID=3452206 RepID=UPI003F888629
MHPLRPGDPERIGTFSIVGLLGEGPRGEVFLGRESDDAPMVAIKLLPAGPETGPDALTPYLDVKRVSSSYVARVLDAGFLADRPYIVREYVEGKSLAQVVAEDAPLSGDALERVAVGVLTALSAVHLAGLSHRSLTPHNVIMGADGPRVTDAAVGEPVGEAVYQAPEQLAGLQYGPYADVFAWAATIVFAGTGKAPFAGPDAVLNAEPEVDIEAEPMRRVLLSALAKEVGQRPTTYSALMQVLGDAGAAKPPTAKEAVIEGVPLQIAPIQIPGQTPPVQDVTLVQGPTQGPPMQGPPAQGPPPMQGMAVPPPMPQQPEAPMWGPQEPDPRPPQQIRLEAMPARPASSTPRRGFPVALVAGVGVVALLSGLGLWGANRYVKLQEVNPASVAQVNANEIPVPNSTAAPVPQGSGPVGADPQQAQPEPTVPWATTAAPDDSGIGPLILPTEWSSSSPSVPELTTAPTTPAPIPTQPVPLPTQSQAAQPTTAKPTPTKKKKQTPTATVTKTVEPTKTPTQKPTKEPTPTEEPEPTPTKTTAKPTPTKTTAKPTPTKTTAKPTPTKTTAKPTPTKTTAKPTPTKTTAKPTPTKTTAKPTPTKTTAKPTPTKTTAKPTPTKTTAKPTPAKNPYTPTQVCGSGFVVQRSSAFTGGVTYQLWNNSTGQNCAVTMKTADVGKSSPVSVTLEAQGGGQDSDSGNFEYYAGPVKVSARGKCVKISGSVGSQSTSTGWANCG